MTNLEGRVVRRRRDVPPPDGVATDVELVCKLAEALDEGRFFRFADTEAICDELGRTTRAPAGAIGTRPLYMSRSAPARVCPS